MPDLDTARRWQVEGERAVAAVLQRLTGDELRGPSALPGWTRAHVVAHLARSADAMVNLCRWARTGAETPMYLSSEARDAGIERSAAQSDDALRADYRDAAARFAETVATMPDEAWHALVRNLQGRAIAAAEVPWMRARELWVHGVDLDAGLDVADVPAGVLTALVDEVLAVLATRGQLPDATILATDLGRTWCAGAARVEGPVAAVAAWLTRGRTDGLTGDVPEVPAWL